jgi:hypothetical protein
VRASEPHALESGDGLVNGAWRCLCGSWIHKERARQRPAMSIKGGMFKVQMSQ